MREQVALTKALRVTGVTVLDVPCREEFLGAEGAVHVFRHGGQTVGRLCNCEVRRLQVVVLGMLGENRNVTFKRGS